MKTEIQFKSLLFLIFRSLEFILYILITFLNLHHYSTGCYSKFLIVKNGCENNQPEKRLECILLNSFSSRQNTFHKYAATWNLASWTQIHLIFDRCSSNNKRKFFKQIHVSDRNSHKNASSRLQSNCLATRAPREVVGCR